MYNLKLILVPNFSSLSWFSFSSTVISCHQLLTAVDSWWQLIWKKFYWNFYVHTKVDTCAKFQLSSLIFILISCQQLLSAVDSWWQLLRKKIKWDFHIPPKVNTCAKFQLCRLLGGLARECDAGYRSRLPVHGHGSRQAKLMLLRLSWACACAWVEQFTQVCLIKRCLQLMKIKVDLKSWNCSTQAQA